MSNEKFERGQVVRFDTINPQDTCGRHLKGLGYIVGLVSNEPGTTTVWGVVPILCEEFEASRLKLYQGELFCYESELTATVFNRPMASATLSEVAEMVLELRGMEALDVPSMGFEPGGKTPTDYRIEKLCEEHGYTLEAVEKEVNRIYNECNESADREYAEMQKAKAQLEAELGTAQLGQEATRLPSVGPSIGGSIQYDPTCSKCGQTVHADSNLVCTNCKYPRGFSLYLRITT